MICRIFQFLKFIYSAAEVLLTGESSRKVLRSSPGFFKIKIYISETLVNGNSALRIKEKIYAMSSTTIF